METETKPSQTAESHKLTDKILINILSRLPVLNLLQYRCVCKSWQSMISDPQFIKTHLHQSTQSLDTQRLMVTHPSNDYFFSIDCKSCHESKRVDSPWKASYYYAEVLCSCDGLVLLCFHYQVFMSPDRNSNMELVLWNPSIRKHVMFRCPCNFINVYGLCFDSSTNSYKLIFLSPSFFLPQSSVWVFDLKTTSWKEIRMPSFSISSRGNGVLVNGALHWIMTSKKCEWSSVIVYFDLMEEKFKEVPKPDCGSKFGKLDLVDLRGWLCVYGWRDQRVMEVWAMKEYGKKESWIKLITIPIQIESNFFWSLKPLCLMKNGEVLVETGNSRELAGYRPREVYVEIGNSRELAVYNPEEGTIKPPQCFWYYGLRAATYVESLVLLNDGDYTTKV